MQHDHLPTRKKEDYVIDKIFLSMIFSRWNFCAHLQLTQKFPFYTYTRNLQLMQRLILKTAHGHLHYGFLVLDLRKSGEQRRKEVKVFRRSPPAHFKEESCTQWSHQRESFSRTQSGNGGTKEAKLPIHVTLLYKLVKHFRRHPADLPQMIWKKQKNGYYIFSSLYSQYYPRSLWCTRKL